MVQTLNTMVDRPVVMRKNIILPAFISLVTSKFSVIYTEHNFEDCWILEQISPCVFSFPPQWYNCVQMYGCCGQKTVHCPLGLSHFILTITIQDLEQFHLDFYFNPAGPPFLYYRGILAWLFMETFVGLNLGDLGFRVSLNTRLHCHFRTTLLKPVQI